MASGPSKAEAMRLTFGWNPPLLPRAFSMPATRRSYPFFASSAMISPVEARCLRIVTSTDAASSSLLWASLVSSHRFLDAITRLLLVLFVGGLVLTGQRDDRDRNTVGAGQEPCETRRELAIRTLIHSEQQAFEIRNEAPGLEFLTLQPLLLRLAQRHPRQRPAQHRRHGHGGGDRHGNDHGEEILGQRAHRQSYRGDNDLGRAACVHAASEREGLAPSQAADFAADERAGELAEARNRDQPNGQEQERNIVQDGEVGR